MKLVEGNVMDVDLFIFNIKDACSINVDNWVAEKVVLEFNFKW